jgi:hypothetical protein
MITIKPGGWELAAGSCKLLQKYYKKVILF